jgi:undecaprenyl-diphosphatase
MRNVRTIYVLRQLSEIDLAVSLFFNRICHYFYPRKFFAIVSRLGDGVFWYALVAVLPVVYGSEALQASAHMLLTSLLGLVIYKALKSRTVRPRPFVSEPQIKLGSAPLDQYSFPSGHTLHAFSFTIVALSYHPELAAILVPFTTLVAMSRLVLGLHYPSDVLAGAAIGTLLALWSVSTIDLSSAIPLTQESLTSYF